MVVIKKDIELERRRIIDRGGSSAEDYKEKSEWKNICLRIPKEMVTEIDKVVKENIGFTRTSWILQTLQQKLKENQNE